MRVENNNLWLTLALWNCQKIKWNSEYGLDNRSGLSKIYFYYYTFNNFICSFIHSLIQHLRTNYVLSTLLPPKVVWEHDKASVNQMLLSEANEAGGFLLRWLLQKDSYFASSLWFSDNYHNSYSVLKSWSPACHWLHEPLLNFL